MKTKFLAYGMIGLLFGMGAFYLLSSRKVGGRNRGEWELLTEGTLAHERRFSHVVFLDKKIGFAVSGSSIERSKDGGVTWEPIQTPGIQGFYSLIFTDTQHGWAVGTENKRPLVLKTTDKGDTWQAANFDEQGLNKLDGKFVSFLDICFDMSGRSWMVGEGGIVEAITDGPNLQIAGTLPTEEILHNVSCSDSGKVWAVGQGGAIYQHQNNWTKMEMDKSYSFKRVFVKDHDIWVLGGSGAVGENLLVGISRPGLLLRSRDNGRTWENKTPMSAGSLYDLFIKDEIGWLVGAEGSIYSSNDGGDSWTKFESRTQNDLRKIFFLDSDNGWICGGNATILKYRKRK